MSMFKLFLVLLVITFLVSPFNIALASSESTPSSQTIQLETVNPGSPYYVFKRLVENFKLNFLTFGEKNKAKYSEELLDLRFKELAHAVKNGHTGYLSNVANRYTNQAGTIIEKYMNIDPNFREQAKTYLPYLANLRDNYPANTPQWLLLQYAVDTTKRIAGS